MKFKIISLTAMLLSINPTTCMLNENTRITAIVDHLIRRNPFMANYYLEELKHDKKIWLESGRSVEEWNKASKPISEAQRVAKIQDVIRRNPGIAKQYMISDILDKIEWLENSK